MPNTPLFLLLALCACAGAGPIPLSPLPWTPEPVPQSETIIGGAKQQPFDLESLLKLAGTAPLAIQVAQARERAAAAGENEALAKWLPTVSPRFSFVRHEGRIQATAGQFLDVQKQNTFAGTGFDLSVNPADAWYESLAAAQRRRAARLGVRHAQHVNTGRAVGLYYDLLAATTSRRVVEQAVDYAKELVSVEQARERAGRGLPADVLRAQAFLASTEGRLARIDAEVSEADARLRALLLLPDEVELVPTEPAIVPIRFPEGDLSLPALLDRAVASRPDLREARALLRAAGLEQERAAWSWLVPELHAGADVGGFGGTVGRLQDRQDYFAGLFWQLRFGTFAKAQAALAKREEAQLRVRSLLQEIRADLQAAKARLGSTRKRIAAARREVEAADAALRLVRARHDQGSALLLEVLDTQNARSEAGIKLVRTITEHNKAQFELKRLVGD